jgi:NAD(P)-dependent dehydrogenase (short-subunit alcohol dehydrogenase family)
MNDSEHGYKRFTAGKCPRGRTVSGLARYPNDMRYAPWRPGYAAVARKPQVRRHRSAVINTRSILPGRVGRPDDIAAMVAFLISSEASFIAGAHFAVEGWMIRKMVYV